jgi:hypothetical protein
MVRVDKHDRDCVSSDNAITQIYRGDISTRDALDHAENTVFVSSFVHSSSRNNARLDAVTRQRYAQLIKRRREQMKTDNRPVQPDWATLLFFGYLNCHCACVEENNTSVYPSGGSGGIGSGGTIAVEGPYPDAITSGGSSAPSLMDASGQAGSTTVIGDGGGAIVVDSGQSIQSDSSQTIQPDTSTTVPETGAGGSDSSSVLDPSASAALQQLVDHLAIARSNRPDIFTQPFADMPLNKQDAAQAQQLLWEDFADFVRETRGAEVGATESIVKTVSVDGYSMRYYMATRGVNPPDGRSLFISMHGGGNAPAATNDQQWQNQITLVDGYDPQDALWVAPRAPSNEWNMWFTEEVDRLFERLITNLIVFEGINPNKVYINGYSAGGDAVYQLGPRMAERWAGAGMSAGHPNTATPENLRNIAFAIHVGGNDTAYDRNLKAEEWGRWLDELSAADPGGYPHQWQVHPGLPHWMNMADAVGIPFLQSYTRDPIPPKVVWLQCAVPRAHFYWLAIDAADLREGAEVRASYEANTVTLDSVSDVPRLKVRLSDEMMDLDQPVRIQQSGSELFSGPVERTIRVIAKTLEERSDPAMIFCSEVEVTPI